MGGVRNKIFDAAHNLVEECRSLYQPAEAWNLTRDGSPHFGLVVLEQLDERGYKVSGDNLLVNGPGNLKRNLGSESKISARKADVSYLLKPIRNHIAHPPTLVLYQASQRRE